MRSEETVGIRVFYGDDRVGAQAEIRRELGENYEVFEGENLTKEDLPGLFFGATLFSEGKRKILIKDLGENKEVFEELGKKLEEYSKTEAEVIVWEGKLDKRSAVYKSVTKAGTKVEEYKQKETINIKQVFAIYDLALRDGAKAVKELEKIEVAEDPYMFFGVMASQAIKKLEWRPKGVKEKRALKELSKLDNLMKSTGYEPWLLIKGFLRRLSSL